MKKNISKITAINNCKPRLNDKQIIIRYLIKKGYTKKQAKTILANRQTLTLKQFRFLTNSTFYGLK